MKNKKTLADGTNIQFYKVHKFCTSNIHVQLYMATMVT